MHAEDGSICASVLAGHDWSPSYTLELLLLNLQSLLDDPNTTSPLNAEAASLYRSQPELYWARVDETHSRNMTLAGRPPEISAVTQAASAAAAAAAAAVAASSASLSHVPTPLLAVAASASSQNERAFLPLSACARRWATTAAHGTFGQPYKLHTDQQEQLLQAVWLRVARESAAASLHAHPTPGSDGAAAARLSPSDETRVRCILLTIVTSPQYFAQLYAMLPRPRVRKGAAAATAAASSAPQVCPYQRAFSQQLCDATEQRRQRADWCALCV